MRGGKFDRRQDVRLAVCFLFRKVLNRSGAKSGEVKERGGCGILHILDCEITVRTTVLELYLLDNKHDKTPFRDIADKANRDKSRGREGRGDGKKQTLRAARKVRTWDGKTYKNNTKQASL